MTEGKEKKSEEKKISAPWPPKKDDEGNVNGSAPWPPKKKEIREE